uniref:MAM domain-containing protein n=1 Tax=Strigamia maritima TaxID=126957 RepID=T1ITU4_STRMM
MLFLIGFLFFNVCVGFPTKNPVYYDWAFDDTWKNTLSDMEPLIPPKEIPANSNHFRKCEQTSSVSSPSVGFGRESYYCIFFNAYVNGPRDGFTLKIYHVNKWGGKGRIYEELVLTEFNNTWFSTSYEHDHRFLWTALELTIRFRIEVVFNSGKGFAAIDDLNVLSLPCEKGFSTGQIKRIIQKPTQPTTVVTSLATQTPDEVTVAKSTEKPMEQSTTEKTTEKPMETTEKPMETTEKPKETTEKPMETTEKPMETTEKPMETTEKPMEITEKPMETTEKPIEQTTTVKTRRFLLLFFMSYL